MKTLFKSSNKILFASLLIFGLVLPYASSATTTATSTKTNNADKENQSVHIRGFCATIDRLESTIDERFVEHRSIYNTKRIEIEQNIVDGHRSLEHEFTVARDTIDEHLNEHFELLYARASTTEEKNAVLNFETTLLNALEMRREAIDEAVNDFKSEIDEIFLSRKNDVEEAIETFAEQTKAVLDEAKTQCLDGHIVTRASVGSELRKVRKNFETQQKKLHTLHPAVSEASKKRKQAVTSAQNQFKNTVQEAVSDLRKVMK